MPSSASSDRENYCRAPVETIFIAVSSILEENVANSLCAWPRRGPLHARMLRRELNKKIGIERRKNENFCACRLRRRAIVDGKRLVIVSRVRVKYARRIVSDWLFMSRHPCAGVYGVALLTCRPAPSMSPYRLQSLNIIRRICKYHPYIIAYLYNQRAYLRRNALWFSLS